MNQVAIPYPSRKVELASASNLLSVDPWRWLLVIAVIAWMNATIHGFRLPWQPIVVSDSNAGSAMRQLVFGAAGCLAMWRLICTRSLGLACVRQLPWCLLALFLLSSVIWANDPTLTIKRSAIFGLALLTLLTLVHASAQPVALMKRCVVYTAGFCAWISIAMSIALPATCSSIPARPGLAGMASHPNTLGAIMFTGWILSLGFSPRQHHERYLWRGLQLGIAMAVFMTGSVTAILVAIFGTFVYGMLVTTSYRRGALLLIGLTITALVLLIGPDTIKSWFFDAVQRDESLSGRDTLWVDVYREGMKQPIFGSGFGSFWYEGRGREITGTWNPRQAHNAYLDVFVDLGIVGLIGVVGLIVSILWRSLFTLIGSKHLACRRSAASLIAFVIACLGMYSWSQSYLLRLDQFTMMVMMWSLLLLGNEDHNRFISEFQLDPESNVADKSVESGSVDSANCLKP